MDINIKKLEAHREVFDENVRDFAKRIGVSHTWYYSLLDGNNQNPRIETIARIARKLDLKSAKDLIQ